MLEDRRFESARAAKEYGYQAQVGERPIEDRKAPGSTPGVATDGMSRNPSREDEKSNVDERVAQTGKGKLVRRRSWPVTLSYRRARGALGRVAQLAGQLFHTEKVAGSSPAMPTRLSACRRKVGRDAPARVLARTGPARINRPRRKTSTVAAVAPREAARPRQ